MINLKINVEKKKENKTKTTKSYDVWFRWTYLTAKYSRVGCAIRSTPLFITKNSLIFGDNNLNLVPMLLVTPFKHLEVSEKADKQELEHKIT